MAKPWSQVEQSEGFKALSAQDKFAAKRDYWDTVVTVKPEYKSLGGRDKHLAKYDFFGGRLPEDDNKKISPTGYERGDRSLIGNVFERPGAAVRGGLTSLASGQNPVEGYVKGANVPEEVPKFQDGTINKFYEKTDKPIESVEENHPVAGAALRFGRNVAGFGASAAGMAGDIVTNPADALTSLIPGAPGAKYVGKAVSEIKPVAAVSKFINKDISLIKPRVAKIDDAIEKTIIKGIRPSVSNMKNSQQSEKYYSKAKEAVISIVENKDNIQFMDDVGRPIKKLPESVQDFSDAISQTKKTIFAEYDSMAKQSNSGSEVNLVHAAKELNSVIKDKTLAIKDPGVIKYAKDLQERLQTAGSLKPSQVQDLIESYNAELKAFYRNPTANDVSRQMVNAGVANILRKNLDETIESVVGPGYQALKNKYGALSAIEKDVQHRALVHGRRNVKGLVDFTDIFSGGQMVQGILNTNPGLFASGLAQKGIASYFKWINSPDTMVKGMFKDVNVLMSRKSTLAERASENINRGISGVARPVMEKAKRVYGSPEQPAPIKGNVEVLDGQQKLPAGEKQLGLPHPKDVYDPKKGDNFVIKEDAPASKVKFYQDNLEEGAKPLSSGGRKNIYDRKPTEDPEGFLEEKKKNFGKEALSVAGGGAALALSQTPAEAKEEDQKRLALSPKEYTKQEEGFRDKPYKDSLNKKTIGYGFNMAEASVLKKLPSEVRTGKRSLTKKEADAIYKELYAESESAAKRYAAAKWQVLNDNQKKALTDMAYNMGEKKLFGFADMRKALLKGDYKTAAKEALNSNYAKQVPNRARRNSLLISGQ